MSASRLLLTAAIAGVAALAGATAWAHAGHPELLRLMDQYEAVRAALAADDVPAALAAAKALPGAAKAARDKVVARTKPDLEGILKAAAALAETEADAAKVRLAFGDLSRAVLTYLAHDGGIAHGRFAFACSMAAGYGKWVQASEQASNPYTGKAMPTCGAPTKIEP